MILLYYAYGVLAVESMVKGVEKINASKQGLCMIIAVNACPKKIMRKYIKQNHPFPISLALKNIDSPRRGGDLCS